MTQIQSLEQKGFGHLSLVIWTYLEFVIWKFGFEIRIGRTQE